MRMIVSTMLEWFQHSRADTDGKFYQIMNKSNDILKTFAIYFFHKIYGKLSVDESNDI